MKNTLEWMDAFSVGDDALDDQHKEMLVVLEDIRVASNGGAGPKEMLALFDRFIAITQRHFRDEEAELIRRNVPARLDHVADHKTMMAKLEAIRDSLGGPDAVDYRGLHDLLAHWFADHAIKFDAKIKGVLQESDGATRVPV